MLPFVIDEGTPFDFESGDMIFVPHVREKLAAKESVFPAKVVTKDGKTCELTLRLGALTDDERSILLEGCLMNHYAAQRRK